MVLSDAVGFIITEGAGDNKCGSFPKYIVFHQNKVVRKRPRMLVITGLGDSAPKLL